MNGTARDDDAPPELSVVMPCLNEARTLPACIAKARASIDRLGIRGEIVVADNGSTDGSAALAEKLGARVVPVAQRGYGNALHAGIGAARGRWVIMGDADDSYDFEHLEPFVRRLREGYDLVMGCRLPRGGGRILPEAMPPIHRYLGNPALTLLARRMFKVPVNDIYCGLRAFRRERYPHWNLASPGMEFATEMIIRASLLHDRICEIPITLHPDGRGRPGSHLRTFRDGWRTLRFLLLYCPKWLFLIPGASLFLLGAALGARIAVAPLHLGPIGLDVNTLLACAMATIVGAQLVFFGLFTRQYAVSRGLLPESRIDRAIARHMTLERGALVSAGTILCGIALLWKAALYWQSTGFGALSYPDSLREMIPAVTLVTLGTQGLFSSFFLSILHHFRPRPIDPCASPSSTTGSTRG